MLSFFLCACQNFKCWMWIVHDVNLSKQKCWEISISVFRFPSIAKNLSLFRMFMKIYATFGYIAFVTLPRFTIDDFDQDFRLQLCNPIEKCIRKHPGKSPSFMHMMWVCCLLHVLFSTSPFSLAYVHSSIIYCSFSTVVFRTDIWFFSLRLCFELHFTELWLGLCYDLLHIRATREFIFNKFKKYVDASVILS